MNRAREAARAALRIEIGRTQDAIEQAVVDGIISDQRSEYAARTEFEVQEVLEFRPRFEALIGVPDELDAMRQARFAHSRERWHRIEPEAAARFTGPRWDAVRSFVESLVARDDRALLDSAPRAPRQCPEMDTAARPGRHGKGA